MQTKTLGLAASLAATAVLGLAGAASAAVFSAGDTLQQGGTVVLDNVTYGTQSILFVPAVGTDPTLGIAAAPGDQAIEFSLPGGNTGAFSGFNTAPQELLIRSFNINTDVSGFNPGPDGNTFVELPAAGPLAAGALLTLTQPISATQDPNVPGRFFFRATGLILDIATGETAPILYDFTAQGLGPSGTPGISVPSSFSGTKIIIVDVPEPSSMLGLLAIGSFVAAGTLKKRKKSANLN